MLTPQHEQQYREEGYCVFDGAIPGPLLLRLRHACEKARQLAREGSPNAQRLQPVGSYSDVGLDQQPFVEYGELAPLRAAVCGLLSQEHGFGDRGRFGVLLEPRDAAWSTFWHRDWRDNIEGIDTSLWWRHFHDRAYFNQINCALYDDECLWVVPGSHLRGDTPAEVARFPTRPVPAAVTDPRHSQAGAAEAQSSDERYRLCLEYAASMPGAVQLKLKAGDFCLCESDAPSLFGFVRGAAYVLPLTRARPNCDDNADRNTLWHCGVYHPDKVRATIHDGQMTPAFRQFMVEARADITERKAQGLGWASFAHEYVGGSPPPTEAAARL
jgi:hypothetical protein